MKKLNPTLSKGYSLSIGIALKAVFIPIAIVGLFGTIESVKTETPHSFQTRDPQIEANQKAFIRGEAGAGIGDEGGQYATVTGYTSRVQETDSSPYITASGVDLKKRFDCIVAHNSLPFGTKVAIDDVGVCEVQDRGALRNGKNWFDVYFGNDVKRALEFGKRELAFRVIG
jgi:3D (Asp-Asp-Asp) domain-containing protein